MFSGPLFNILFMAIILLFAALFIYLRWLDLRKRPPVAGTTGVEFTIEAMTSFVKQTLHELTHSQLTDLGLHEEEYKRRLNQRSELRKALKNCISGDVHEKQYVKQFMADLLVKSYGVTEGNIDQAIPFADPRLLNVQDQFEIIFYLYKLQYGQDALSMMLELHGLAELRVLPGYGDEPVYAVTASDVEQMYANESRSLTFSEKLEIVVQRIYQQFKGFSVIDELRDQRIDGVSGGVSGILADESFAASYGLDPLRMLQASVQPDRKARMTESVWIFYRGKTIHMACLSFGTELELKRVCQNIYKYNHPGQLSEANGYKVNEMKDGSRVVVVRPPFSESWAFFVRKFDIRSATLEQLVTGDNAQLPIQMLRYLMKGSRITAITGAQGSGKTTLLMAMIEHIYPTYTLRVQEMAFELHLRKIYSRRNILSFRETDRITGQEGLDLQKKTDGTVNILGEVASDGVSSWMIQMSQVASLFTVFTHHAKTFRDLIFSLRNSLLKSGVFHHEAVAEQQVVQVINFDIHLKRDAAGRRYIERITECIPREKEPLGMIEDGTHGSVRKMLGQFMQLQAEYYRRVHDQSSFSSRNIIEFRDGGYVAAEPISERNLREMAEQMSVEDAVMFKNFAQTNWGNGYGS
ncbi:Flp pilus assembly complex ATPase component TadA [Paenibacillus cellulositrophicus]|uniref:ATPase, T2SS/T4P/T4SS family n=1 Tax=Paenibacillus cellulositrophicus TaxID=562959 RepID=UPI00203E39A5|nr:ATPase, T2SS/T4P/T4SS family [Paenibacillus cellulositrophicus]MCM2999090.1 Flp pilus assembly complex ATPase component TadA [Paenibacillus cellulositrophicus]